MNHFLRILGSVLLTGIFTMNCGSSGGGSGGGGEGGGGMSAADCLSGKITTWGEAPIFTSIDAARDKAKENACRTAIEKCIGEQVAKTSGVGNGQSIANEIFSESKGICKNDQIVDEKTYKLDTIDMLKVFVSFEVGMAKVTEAINTAQKLAGNPKVMVLIREKYIIPDGKRSLGFTSSEARASGDLREFLINQGYSIIPPEKAAMSGNEEATVIQAIESGSSENEILAKLKDNAVKAGADVLIIGALEINAQDLKVVKEYGGGDIKSVKATGNVKILTLWGKGKEMGVYTQQSNGADTTHLGAAREAAHRYAVGSKKDWKRNAGMLARFVDEKLKDEWARVTKANEIILKISGMDSKAAGMFRDDLKERTSVKAVNEQSSENENHVWEVIYPGRSFSLAETIAYYGDNPGMFVVVQKHCRKVKVDSVNRGEIVLSFVAIPSDTKYRCVPANKL